MAVSGVFVGIVVCSGLVKGVTSLNDGRAGAGFISDWIFSRVGRVGGAGALTGAGSVLGASVGGGIVAEGVLKGSVGCKRLGRAIVGGAEGKWRLSINGD